MLQAASKLIPCTLHKHHHISKRAAHTGRTNTCFQHKHSHARTCAPFRRVVMLITLSPTFAPSVASPSSISPRSLPQAHMQPRHVSHVRAHTHTRTHAHTHTRTHTQARTHERTHTHARTHTHTCTHKHARTHARGWHRTLTRRVSLCSHPRQTQPRPRASQSQCSRQQSGSSAQLHPHVITACVCVCLRACVLAGRARREGKEDWPIMLIMIGWT